MRIFNKFLILTLFILFVGATLDVDAQNNRRKRTRRTATTSQTVPRPTLPVQAEIISTAEDELRREQNGGGQVEINPATGQPVRNGRQNSQPAETGIQSRDAAELARQVTELTNKIKALENSQRGLLDLERLTRAEERAAALRRQLTETIDKEGSLNAKLEQLEYQSRPEIIQIETATIGSTRPEEVREARRKSLESEKQRVREQITVAQQNRMRLESAVANADALVEKLRARVEEQFDEEKLNEGISTRDSAASQNTVTTKDDEQNPPDNRL